MKLWMGGNQKAVLTVSNWRDVLETNMSPTAVFHLAMNSSSSTGSFCEEGDKKKSHRLIWAIYVNEKNANTTLC